LLFAPPTLDVLVPGYDKDNRDDEKSESSREQHDPERNEGRVSTRFGQGCARQVRGCFARTGDRTIGSSGARRDGRED